MENKNLKNSLYHSLGQEIQPERLDETINGCKEIMREYKYFNEEPRTSFFDYLSDVFRFEGIPIIALQGVTLFVVCLLIKSVAGIPENIPIFIPLFVLAIMPVLFRSQFYGMSEIEAVTRASGAQITLAKLVLAGAANLVCITTILCMELSLPDNNSDLGQMVLYCFVPYLLCMAGMLRIVRLRKKESIRTCAFTILISSMGWAVSAKLMPWIYATSATGCWMIAFVVFGTFFLKEVLFILEMRKEGKMYGIIA